MKLLPSTLTLLSIGILVAHQASAADVRINGFASVVGGKTLNQGTARGYFDNVESKAVFSADRVSEGIYDDDISFKPDSNYGVQLRADLGDGLSATGQITGNGGEDFDAVVSWAYVSYDLNDHWSLQAGRQRLPFFFYSDFIDVGYAYHWIRPPTTLATAVFDTFEGVKVINSATAGNWDIKTSVMAGAGNENVSNQVDVEQENLAGIVIHGSNDWLQLRASYFVMQNINVSDVYKPAYRGVAQGTDDNPTDYTFWGLAAHMNFENLFVVSEYTFSETDEPTGADYGLSGFKDNAAWYISSGYRMGKFTPHITYGEYEEGHKVIPIINVLNGSFTERTSDHAYKSWTVGLRWDFHPSAAAKIEYTTQSDESDSYTKNSVGRYGYADAREVDLISAGIDIIF